jgi:hypothetical protein
MMRKGILEVGVIRSSHGVPPGFTAHVTIPERLLAYFKRDNPWLSPNADTIPFSALKGVPLSISRGFLTEITNSCHLAGFSPSILCVGSSRALARMWARQGKTVAILVGPDPKAEEKEECCYKPMEGSGSKAERIFITYSEREISVVAQTFLQFSEDYIEEVDEDEAAAMEENP